MSALGAILVATAALAGATGTFSPCGFSMVDTLGSAWGGRRRTLLTACATFTLGALAGGAATFTVLAGLGALASTGGREAAALAAAAVAACAALAEARGARVLPQIRRQVPEHWRRTMPLPVAAALYGVLLGLGFTTFVLTLAVWALAGISVALGDPALGALVGLAFGAGRALPVVALAPLRDTAAGARALEAMAERPTVLRGLRLADAAALGACAIALGAGAAVAATPVAAPATDPSAVPGALAWQVPGVGGFMRRGGETVALSGSDPAVGGSFVAWRNGDSVTLARRSTLVPIGTGSIPGLQKLAVSSRWLAWRRRTPNGSDVIGAIAISGAQRGRPDVASASPPSQLGRPALDGDTLAFHVAGSVSRIVTVDLASGQRRVLRSGRRTQYLNPSLLGSRVLYVAVSACRQELQLGSLTGRASRVLYRTGGVARRDSGHEHGHTRQGSGPSGCPGGNRAAASNMMWTTGLSPAAAYLTLLRPLSSGLTSPRLVRIGL